VPSAEEIKAHAVRRAAELGFCLAGVAPAGQAEHAEAFGDWIAAGRHASMAYLARDADKRRDPRAVRPWAKSLLCLAAGYAPAAAAADGPIARYARGRDYHKVLKRRCRVLADELARMAPGLATLVCVDTAPLLERDHAARAGLGWIGKNACLTHPAFGSDLLLAEIVLSIELPPDEPMEDRCGDCRRCLEACPNGALVAPRVLDARRCIAWATVEHRGRLDGETMDLRGQVFGCDVCRLACPFNRSCPPGLDELSRPGPIADADVLTVLNWSSEDWDLATRGSAARRATWAMFLRNAALVAGQRRLTQAVPALKRLTGHGDPAAAEAAKWARGRIGEAN